MSDSGANDVSTPPIKPRPVEGLGYWDMSNLSNGLECDLASNLHNRSNICMVSSNTDK